MNLSLLKAGNICGMNNQSVYFAMKNEVTVLLTTLYQRLNYYALTHFPLIFYKLIISLLLLIDHNTYLS